MLRLTSEGIVAIAILTYVGFQHGRELGYLLALVSIVVLSYDQLVRKRIHRAGKISNIANTNAIARINESIDGYREIRILSRERFFLKRIEEASQKSAHNFFVAQTIASIPRYLFETSLVIFFVFLILVSIESDSSRLTDKLPMFGLFGVVALRLLPSATLLTTGLSKLRFGLQPIQQIRREIYEYKAGQTAENLGDEDKQVGYEQFESLELRNVSFRYPGRSQACIDEVSLTIVRGEMIGIVGESGVGKTTLIDIMLGLISPTGGAVLVNGQDLEVDLVRGQRLFYYMSQHGFMIDGSVEENLRLDDHRRLKNRELLDSAARAAGLDHTLRGLPDGIYTEVGDRGGKLSGGQRQRVELARAFFHTRQVFFLDEPTSALDAKTKAGIRKEISGMRPSRTVIIVSHDPVLLQDCDRIFELKTGKLSQK